MGEKAAQPESVGQFLERARRRSTWACALQAGALAFAAAAAVAAAIELDGAPSLRVETAIPAALAAFAAAAAWMRERAPSTESMARDADRRLARHGELRTAFEAERGARGEIARLLSSRSAGALDRASLARAAPWPALGWLALPLAASAAWLAARELRTPAHPELAEAARAAAAALGAAADVGGGERAEWREAADLARSIELAASAARPDERRLAEDRARLAERLEQLASSDERSPPQAAELEVSRERLAQAPGGAPRAGPRAADRSSGGPPTLQTAAAERTIKGSTDERASHPPGVADPASPTSEPSPSSLQRESAAPLEPAGPPGVEPGVAAGKWWSAEHDDVVAHWRRAGN